MTILQELAALYDRRAEDAGWPRPGYSTEKIGAVVILREDGSVAELRSLMSPDARGKKLLLRSMVVPAPPPDRRGMKIVPGLFWDPAPYALGISAKSGKPVAGDDRSDLKFAAFRAAHLEVLTGAADPALIALRRFCETWIPETFATLPDGEPLVDQNVVFRLGDGPFLHDLPAAQALLASGTHGDTMCLVTGAAGATARLHPSIKGVMGAQPSGASLVSFNNDAETSHGKTQGANAPVSEAAAFAYGTALNALLSRDRGQNLRIGGDTVVFWAHGTGDAAAGDAFLALFASGKDRDPRTENELASRLTAMSEGRARADDPLDPATRLFVLGLAPNAARLSVRYWLPGSVGDLAAAATRFWSECAITPSPFVKGDVAIPPKPWVLLSDLAAQRDEKNIPPKLGGELMRAILTGGRFPATLLAAAIGRIRVEGDPDRAGHGNIDGRRAALIRAVLIRNHDMEVPMALDETADDPAYLLGRLFAAYAYAERSYQERGASLRAKYMGAASATPARVFPVLMRGYEHNLASLRKAGGAKTGSGVKADRAVAAILDLLPGGSDLPTSLALEEQARFFVGFYHQLSAFYAKAEDAAEDLIDTETEVAQ